MAYETILYSVEEEVATLTLNRPECKMDLTFKFVMRLWLQSRKQGKMHL